MTCCKVKNVLSLSLKATLEFFFLFILWNLTKTIYRRFYSRFTNICNYIDSKILFFRIWGFRGIENIFWGGSVFEEIMGWRESRTDIHSSGFTDCCWKQFDRRIRRPMKLLRAYLASIFFSLEFRGWNKRKKAWPTPKFCGWCLCLYVTIMFWIRVWFGKVKQIWERRGAYILVAKRVPD